MVISSGGMDDAGVGKYPAQGTGQPYPKKRTKKSNTTDVDPNGTQTKPKKKNNTTTVRKGKKK